MTPPTDPERLRAYVEAHMVPNPRIYKGFVARGGRLVPWYEADTVGPTSEYRKHGVRHKDGTYTMAGRNLNREVSRSEKRLFRQLGENLPTVRKRTPQERLKEMTDTLVRTGVRHPDGSWSFPRSVTRAIQKLTGQQGEFWPEAVITRYAAALLEEAERKNEATRTEVRLAHP